MTKTYEEILDATMQNAQLGLDPAGAERVRQYDPDTAAQAQQAAVTTGLPVSTVAPNLPEVQERLQLREYDRFLRDNQPVRMLGDDFHAVARDDVDTLDQLRLAGKNLGAGLIRIGGSTAGVLEAVEEGLHALGTAPHRASNAALGTNFDLTSSPFTETAAYFAELHKKATAQADKLTKDNENAGVFAQGVYGGLQSLATNGPLLLGAVVARSPQLAMAGMTGLVFGDEYSTGREAGLSPARALLYGGTQAGVEYVTEKLPVGLLFGDIAKNSGLLKTLTTQLVSEIPGEQVATILQDFTQWVTLNPEKTTEQYLAERPDAAVQTLIATVVATGVQGAVVHQIGTRMSAEAMQAEEREGFLKELAGLAEASKLRERSPEQFARYMETVAPDTEIYLDAADAEKLLQSDAELSDDLEARIAEGAEADTPVRITAAEYATYFAESHTAQAIAARARVGSPVAMNAEEAKAIEGEFAARAEQSIVESDNAEAARADARKINEAVTAQIMSSGRFRQDVASQYATLVENFFVTMAQRSGMTAGELFAQYPLRVQAAAPPATDDTLDQVAPESFEVDESADGEQFVIRSGEAARMELDDVTEKFFNPTMQIKLAEVHPDRRGEGIGQQLIQRAYELARSKGRRLVSDRAVSTKQLRAYEALRRRGWTIEYSHPDIVARALDDGGQRNIFGGPAGVSSPDGQPIVRRIEPPAEVALNQDALQPVAARAAEAGELPSGFTRFRHFGNFDVPTIDPEFMGTGMRGEESRRAGPRVTSLYPDTGFQKESGVGPHEFVVDVPTSQLYDANADPMGLAAQSQQALSFTMDENGKFVPAQTRFDMDAFEKAVKDAGFAGYTTPEAEGNLRGQARLFNAVPVTDGRTSPVEETTELFQLKPENEPEGFHLVEPHLTDTERAKLMKHTAQKLVDIFKSLPKDVDFADAARAGEAKRGWYESAVKALRQVFGDVDAPRFAALLAATSPQVGVQLNLQNAAGIWAAWDAAGRPTSKQAINNIMNETLGGPQSVLNAWRNNTVRALSAEDPHTVTLSGPKVNSFMRNLMGDTQEVTNDTWMANFAAIQQTVFSGSATKTGPGKRPGYLAYIAKIRRVAEKLGWTPAEVQETIWSWTKTAYELADVAGETRSVEELVRAGEITDARVAGASDFATMLKENAPIRNILEAAGYGDQIKALEVEFGGESGGDSTRPLVTPALLRSARRLDEVRRRRQEESEQVAEEAAGPMVGTLLNIGLNVNDGSRLTQEQVLAKLDEFEAKVERSVIYASDTEPTLVIKLTSPMKKAELDALSEDLKQEAIVQAIDGQGALYGPQAEKWGPYNPEFFLTLDGQRASEVETLAQEEPAAPKQSQPRGNISLGKNMQLGSVITLFEEANLSTFLHESGHFFFEVMADLAARPNAPQAIQDDMRTLMTWLGEPAHVSFQEWRNTPIHRRRHQHERFARGFEAWLMEGTAPNEEMRGLFHRFRAWLVNIYKSVERLNVSLTDEVRTVMQGMVATEQQIKDAEAARSYMPLFMSADAAGMTPEEWAAYQDTTRAATEHAQDALQARSMKNLRWLDNARTRELKKLQADNKAKRAAVQAEVEAEIAQDPARVAETVILDGTAWIANLVDGTPEEIKVKQHKLSIPALQEAYGTREEYREMLEASGTDASGARAPWEALPAAMLTKDAGGLSADAVAEMTGFSSGDQLITALLALPPRAPLVQQMTDQRMMERYGDLTNPQSLARAVDQAVHNQHRTRVVTSELQALDETLKTQPGGMQTIKRAARDYAQKTVARQKIRDVRPAQYLAAETRAARDSRALLANGNLKAAAVRKRDQLFNGYASKEASAAMESIDKGLRYLRTFGETSVRAKLDPSYRDQIDKLLERFDLRRASIATLDKRAALQTWIKEQEANGTEPVIPEELVDETRKTNYQNLSVEQFAGLVDGIKNIEHLARLKKRLLVAREQKDFDTAVTEIVDSVNTHAPKGEAKVQLERDLSMWGRFSEAINAWFTHLRKMSSVSRQIDGGLDGGKFWSYMMQPVNAAADQEVAMRAAATKKLNALLDRLPALQNSFAQKVVHKVKGPPVMHIPAIGTSLSLEGRLAVALNWGNEGNRERIKEGNQWTDAQAEAVINTLTKEEMDFVQATWDFIGSYWKDIAAKEERVTGVRPTRVDPIPVITRHGQYAGGYYPIVADPARSDKAAQQNDAELIAQSLRGAVSRATTRRGHTKARVGGKDPVRLDLGVITQHVGQVIHDLSWHEALIDSGRLLRDKRLSGALREHYGAEITRLMRKTLDDVARGEVIAQDAGEKLANYFRVGTTIAGMGLSVTTALLQPTGVTQSLVRVGYRHMAGGLLQFAASPLQSITDVRAKSTFMRHRGQVLNRELGEITNRLEQNSALVNFYFMPIQALQTGVDIPTWLGAYNKAFEAGETDERAIHLADQAVRDSQSSGQMQDLAEAQRGGAWKKLWTNFYSYFSATYQLSAESIQQFKRRPGIVPAAKMTADFFMLYTVPAVLGLLIREGLRGDLDDDDPEALAEALLKAQLSAMVGVFPYFRELGGVIQGYDYRGPAGANIIGQLGDIAVQVGQGEVDEPLARAVNRAAGTAFHYPAAQVDRTVRGIIAIAEGEAGPQALLVGPPKKEN